MMQLQMMQLITYVNWVHGRYGMLCGDGGED